VAEAVAPVLIDPLRRGSKLPFQILVHPAFLAPATRRTAFPARQNRDRPHELATPNGGYFRAKSRSSASHDA